MIPMYKKGGKSPKKKSSFMEKSKEITFGDKPDIKKSGGLYSAAEKSENIATLKKMDPSAKKKTGGSRFQEMSAKGKKGMGGMSDSTSSNDAGMSMMKNPDKPGTAVGRFFKSIFKPKSKSSSKPGYNPKRSKKPCKGKSCFEEANDRSGMNWRK